MKPSLINEVRNQKKLEADIESIKTFEINLRELLLSAPAGMKPTLAIDPGFRSGCKVSVLDTTGKFLEYQAVFPHTGQGQRREALATVKHLIEKYKILNMVSTERLSLLHHCKAKKLLSQSILSPGLSVQP